MRNVCEQKTSIINLVILCCLWTDTLLLESVYTPKGYPEFESRSLRKRISTDNGCRIRHPFYTFRLHNMCSKKECISILQEYLPRIQSEFGVTGLCLFGSMARGDNRPDSDVDLLVDMPPKILLLAELKIFLEQIYNRIPPKHATKNMYEHFY